MSFKRVVSTLLVILAMAGFIWTAQYVFFPPSSPKTIITLGKASWVGWEAFHLATQHKELKKTPYQTRFMHYAAYEHVLAALERGELDGATLTIYEALLALSRGIKIKIVLLLDYTTGSDGVVAKRHIRSLLDLKGKHIGVEQGAISHFTMLKALEKGGIDKHEVTFVFDHLKALEKAFLSGDIDVVATYEPYLSALAQSGDGHIIFSSKEIPRAICDVLFIRDDLPRRFHERKSKAYFSYRACLDRIL